MGLVAATSFFLYRVAGWVAGDEPVADPGGILLEGIEAAGGRPAAAAAVVRNLRRAALSGGTTYVGVYGPAGHRNEPGDVPIHSGELRRLTAALRDVAAARSGMVGLV